jgi:hypothetical protein
VAFAPVAAVEKPVVLFRPVTLHAVLLEEKLRPVPKDIAVPEIPEAGVPWIAALVVVLVGISHPIKVAA